MIPAPADPEHATTVLRTVDSAAAGKRLDVFLAGQPEVPTRVAAKEMIEARRALVDGEPAKPGQTLEAGQTVAFVPPLPAAPPAAEAVAPPAVEPVVLHEDAWILVLDKPAGLVCHPSAAGPRGPNVAAWAEQRCPGLPCEPGPDRPGIVHRLDRETSGVMVLARTEDAFHFLKGEFKARRVEKRYRAICYGEARFDSDFIDRNIATHPVKGDRVQVVKEGGREAQTYYEVVERFHGFTDFLCKPRTGRTHQIRVHMTSVGHSLVGDRFYRSRNNSQASLPEGAPDPGRHCLHAWRLEFRHPHTHEMLAFAAEFPADMRELLAWLRANRGGRVSP